jgi:phosphoribosylformylglycinamidine cyclo-ligase
MCHITGGGLPDNLPRVLPEGLGVRLHPSSWTPDPIFDLIQKRGDIADAEMWRTFNMGIGFTLVVDRKQASSLLGALDESDERAFSIGEVIEGEGVTFST